MTKRKSKVKKIEQDKDKVKNKMLGLVINHIYLLNKSK